jgi:hypothetical protein
MGLLVWAYLIYLFISISLTIWVAKTLSSNGLVFLVDAFSGNRELANSVNHLLVVGFYLVNIGYISMALKAGFTPANIAQTIELLSQKIGCVLLILGGMHFFNIYIFNRMRRRGMLRHEPPPVAPRQMVPVPAQG